MADVEKLRYPLLPLANVQTLKIGDIYPYPYFSNNKVEYLSLAESIKTGVIATQSNQSKPYSGSFKESVKQILCYTKEYMIWGVGTYTRYPYTCFYLSLSSNIEAHSRSGYVRCRS